MTTEKQENWFGLFLGANLATIATVVIIGFFMQGDIDAYLKTLVPPNITVTPSDVEVVVPDQTESIRKATSKHLNLLHYYELSLLIDSEFTSFMRMYGHYEKKPSPELKAMIVQQASRIDKIQAVREDAWILENREVGDRQNDFSPLKPVIDDVLESIGAERDGSPNTNSGESGQGSGESPGIGKGIE